MLSVGSYSCGLKVFILSIQTESGSARDAMVGESPTKTEEEV
jgi:hypothetical protein